MKVLDQFLTSLTYCIKGESPMKWHPIRDYLIIIIIIIENLRGKTIGKEKKKMGGVQLKLVLILESSKG